MEHVTGQRIHSQLRPASMQIDIVVSRPNQFTECVRDSFRDRPIHTSWTGTRQIELIVRRASTEAECWLVHARHQGYATAQVGLRQLADQPPRGRHRLEFVSMYAPRDHQMRTVSTPENRPGG